MHLSLMFYAPNSIALRTRLNTGRLGRKSNSTPPMSQAPGWYPDTNRENQERWWDGSNWTESIAHLAPSEHGLSEVFVVRESRKRNAHFSIVSTLVALGGAAMLLERTWSGVLPLLTGAIPAVVLGVRALRPGTLIADRDGLTENVWLRAPRKFRWSEVAVFKIITLEGQDIVYVEINKSDQTAHDGIVEELIQNHTAAYFGHKVSELPLMAMYHGNKRVLAEELATKLNTMLRTHYRS